MIKSINIIGAGNVATVLAKALKDEIEIKSIFSKQISHAITLANIVGGTAIDNIHNIDQFADLNIIAIKDDAIKEIVLQLPNHIPTVHTSGSINIDALSNLKTYGILYPLQTFSKSSNFEISEVPFFIEANNVKFEDNLKTFCEMYLSKKVYIANSVLRGQIHLAAVISNNFMTALLAESEQILIKNELSLDILKPLLIETLNKSFEIGPKNAQTGPAKRGDSQVILEHLSKIGNPKLKEVYRLMSEMITESNH